MPAIINSDNGVVSGSAGLKTSGANDGILVFQTSGTETARINTDSQIVAVAGTASLPALTFTGDLNTGIYSPGADRIGFAEGGVQVGEFDASGNFLMNSGYGSAAVAYGCRAWVNFNGAGTLTGTYSQSGTAITVTITSHGLSQGQSVYITFQTGTASAEAFTVTSVTNANVFVVTSATSRTTSGNCTLATIIRASGNVSSITDNGTGDYTVNFTTAMVDANYVVAGTCGGNSLGVSVSAPGNGLTQAAGSVRITTGTPSAAFDPSQVQLSIFR